MKKTRKTVYLIMCTHKKRTVLCKAREMYTGSFARAALTFAEASANDGDHIFILSSQYGILDLDKIIEPYDLALHEADPRSHDGRYLLAWKKAVLEQLAKRGINVALDRVVFLVRGHYTDIFKECFADNILHAEYPVGNMEKEDARALLHQWAADATWESQKQRSAL